jgi:hypothetical protein
LLIESADREEKLSKRLTSLEIEFLKNKQELERMYIENEKQTLNYQELNLKCEQLKGTLLNIFPLYVKH